jgi:hypothetical protein
MYFGQNAITMAKEALKIFIHSLPEGSKFNVCSFGSRFEFLFDSQAVVDYTESNMNYAIEQIETFDK